MSIKINGRTPEEIKKGLECCAEYGNCSEGCPYNPIKDCGHDLYSDALAYIQQLEATQPKWISVEERLPEQHRQKCVGLYSQHGHDKPYPYPFVFTWYAYGDNGYVNGPHFSDEGLDGLKVHYWMPLPVPPDEAQKDTAKTAATGNGAQGG